VAPRASWRSFAAGRDPPVEELLRDSVATEDETPLHQGPTERRKKPRSPPKPPSLTPGTDLSDKSVIMFPGQGAQFVGMGKEVLGVPSVRELYDEASQILGYDLLRLSLEGPQEVLDRTSYCQAATVVSSLAAVEFLYQESPPAVEECLAVAGFSVGEVTAAIFTGALTLTEGISLVKVRGEAMEAAAEMAPQGMVTVFVGADSKLGFGCEVAREWCRRHHGIEDPICQVANHLYCGAKVVGGHDAALEFLDNNKQDFNIRWPSARILEVLLCAVVHLLLSRHQEDEAAASPGGLPHSPHGPCTGGVRGGGGPDPVLGPADPPLQ